MLSHELKRCRIKRGMTQAELAEKLSVSQNTISQYERGGRFPSVKRLSAISKILGVPIESILNE